MFKNIKKIARSLLYNEDGQVTTEYLIIIIAMAVILIALFTTVLKPGLLRVVSKIVSVIEAVFNI